MTFLLQLSIAYALIGLVVWSLVVSLIKVHAEPSDKLLSELKTLKGLLLLVLLWPYVYYKAFLKED